MTWRGEWLAGLELAGEVIGRLALFQSIGWVPGNDLAYLARKLYLQFKIVSLTFSISAFEPPPV